VALDEPPWILGATCRCLTEDLGLPPEICDQPVGEIVDAHQVLADFVKKRTDFADSGRIDEYVFAPRISPLYRL
jgi:hypothetical protein